MGQLSGLGTINCGTNQGSIITLMPSVLAHRQNRLDLDESYTRDPTQETRCSKYFHLVIRRTRPLFFSATHLQFIVMSVAISDDAERDYRSRRNSTVAPVPACRRQCRPWPDSERKGLQKTVVVQSHRQCIHSLTRIVVPSLLN